MKPKLLSLLVIVFLSTDLMYAQSATPTTSIDGKYFLMNAERSPKGGTTNEMLMQFAERNGQQMLVVAACEQGCTPMVYSYQKEPSEALGFPVFFNSFGYYMLTYDEDSFVSVIPDGPLGNAVWSAIRYSNFFSKGSDKAKGMTAEKIKNYAIDVSSKMMKE